MRYLVLGAFLGDKPIEALGDHAEVVLKRLHGLLPDQNLTLQTTGHHLVELYDGTYGPTRRLLDTMVLFPKHYARRLLQHWDMIETAQKQLVQHNRSNTEKLLVTATGIAMLVVAFYTHSAYTLLQEAGTPSKSVLLRAIAICMTFIGHLLAKMVS